MKKRCQHRQALALLAASLSGFALAVPTFPEQEKICTFNAAREAARALSAANFPTPFASEMLVNGVSVWKFATGGVATLKPGDIVTLKGTGFGAGTDIDFSKINLYSGNYTFWYETSQLLLKQRADKNKKNETKKAELLDFIARFRQEACSAAKLMHPNIVNVYDVGVENNIYYIVMEYVVGVWSEAELNHHIIVTGMQFDNKHSFSIRFRYVDSIIRIERIIFL